MTGESAASLRDLACHCRRLALGADSEEVAASLNEMASRYERRADEAEARDRPADDR